MTADEEINESFFAQNYHIIKVATLAAERPISPEEPLGDRTILHNFNKILYGQRAQGLVICKTQKRRDSDKEGRKGQRYKRVSVMERN